jgi:hypothetical protein
MSADDEEVGAGIQLGAVVMRRRCAWVKRGANAQARCPGGRAYTFLRKITARDVEGEGLQNTTTWKKTGRKIALAPGSRRLLSILTGM